MSQLRTEKDFPRLFSISTVNLRNHKHSDYLFHPLRTDITGQSNLGKSTIAAEALQLIFIANKNFWSSPTDTTRKISGMSLRNQQGEGAAYLFVNIEVKANQFLVFGVYIKANSDTPEPFIVQDRSKETLEWKIDVLLKPFQRFLRHNDFLNDGDMIPSTEQIKKKLDEKGYNISFFPYRHYHKFLVKNEVIPFDINNDNDLKIYAEILQSFSRGKILEDKGKSMSEKLKNFLFADNNEQNDEYKKQKQEIEESQKKFREQSQTIELIEQKQSCLLALLDLQEKKAKAKQTALFVETAYYFQQKNQTEKDLKEAEKDLTTVKLKMIACEYKRTKLNIDEIQENIDAINEQITLDQEKLNTENQKHTEATEKIDVLNQAYSEAKENYDDALSNNKKVKQVSDWLKVYSHLSTLKNKFEEQPKVLRQQENLDSLTKVLQENSLLQDFTDSEYAKNFHQAKQNYQSRSSELANEISRLEQLQPLFDKTSQNSFAQWAIHEAKKLSREQESVLFHFIDKTLTKPTNPKPNARFIIEPKKLLENLAVIENDEKGFWIGLNGLGEYIKAVENPLFNNPATLPDELRKYGDSIKVELKKKQEELNRIKHLDDLLVSFGFNQDHTDLFQNQGKIADYEIDKSLTMDKEVFEKLLTFYNQNIDTAEQNYRIAGESLTQATNKRRDNTAIIDNSNTQILLLGANLKEKKEKLEKVEKEIKRYQEDENKLENKFNKLKEDKINILPKLVEIIFINLVIYADETLSIEIAFDELGAKQYIEKINEEIPKIGKEEGRLESEVKTLLNMLPKQKEGYLKAFDNYQQTLGIEFEKEKIEKKYTFEDVGTVSSEAKTTQDNYKTEYLKVLNDDRFKVEKSEILFEQKNSEDPDLYSLAKVLLTDKIIVKPETLKQDLDSGVADKLKAISGDLLELSNKNKTIIRLLFNRVYDMIDEYESKVKNLQDFFEKNPVAGNYHVELERTDSKVYPKNWIEKFKKKFLDDVFDKKWRNMHKSIEHTADNLIIEVFKEVTGLDYKATNPRNLLEPKSYFDLEIYLKTPTGKRTSYTGGTGYALLALLSIARLSEIDKDKNRNGKNLRKGIRYMAIDEVAGLGENFDMLIQVAKQYDYQIITMTISFIGNIGEEGIYYYNLMRGTEDENATPFAILHKNGITKEQFAEDEYKAVKNYTQNTENYQKYLEDLQNG